MTDFLASEFGMHLREMAKRVRLLALTGLLVALAVFGFRTAQPNDYVATSTVRVVVDDQWADDGSITAFQTNSLAEIAGTAESITGAARASGADPDIEVLRDRIVITVRDTPGYLDISASATTTTAAADLANAMAGVLVDRAERDAPDDSGRSAILIDPADSLDAEPTMTRRRALTEAIALGLLAAIIAGELLVGWRLFRGRFSPIDARTEVERLLGAPVIDLRDGSPLLPFYLDHLSERGTLTVLQAGTIPELAPDLARAAGDVHGRVLLVDGDTGRPVLHTALGEAQSPGLAEIAQGSQPMRAVVRPGTSDMRAAVLTAGRLDRSHHTAAGLLPTLRRVVDEVGADQVIVSITQASSNDEILQATRAFPQAVVLAIDPTGLRVADVRQLLASVRGVKANIVAGALVRPSDVGSTP